MLGYLSTISAFWSTRERNTHKFKALFWAIKYYGWISVLRRRFADSNLSYVLRLHPYLLFMCRLKAYVLKQVTPEFTLQRLLGHYQVITQHFGSDGVRLIHGNGLDFDEFYLGEHKVDVLLQYVHLMRYEGQLTVALRLDGEVFYYAHVHFFDGAMWIGGFQGRPGQLELSRYFTRLSHGVRPQNFMFLMLTLLAKRLGLAKIYAVSGEHHYYQKENKTLDKVYFDYDAFWQELGGCRTSEGIWYSLPPVYPRKNYADIPSKKRSQYLQRYQLFDHLERAQIAV